MHEGLGLEEIRGGPALDEVARQGERGAGETDQRQAPELPAGQSYRAQDAGEPLLGLEVFQAPHVGRGADGIVYHRARREAQARAHGLERQEDVGEDDGRVHGKGLDGLERHLAGELGGLGELEDRVFFAQAAIFGHVATRLAHEPDRDAVHRPSAAGLDEAGSIRGTRHTLYDTKYAITPSWRRRRRPIIISA
jgi:hypothetical protein